MPLILFHISHHLVSFEIYLRKIWEIQQKQVSKIYRTKLLLLELDGVFNIILIDNYNHSITVKL